MYRLSHGCQCDMICINEWPRASGMPYMISRTSERSERVSDFIIICHELIKIISHCNPCDDLYRGVTSSRGSKGFSFNI